MGGVGGKKGCIVCVNIIPVNLTVMETVFDTSYGIRRISLLF